MDGFKSPFTTQNDLVDYLIKTNTLKSQNIIEAFKKIDRADFVPSDRADFAYADNALPIGYLQTISQPTTVAIMLEELNFKVGQTVLDIGSGSGWTTALLSEIVGEKGQVVGVEIIPELVKFGQLNLSKYYFNQAQIKQATDTLDIPGQQFDRILVSAATDKLPDELIKQLKPSGRMVVPIQHTLTVVSKNSNNQITQKEIPGFVFVPLIKINRNSLSA